MPTTTDFPSKTVLECYGLALLDFVCCQSYANAQHVFPEDDQAYYKIRSPTVPSKWIHTSAEKGKSGFGSSVGTRTPSVSSTKSEEAGTRMSFTESKAKWNASSFETAPTFSMNTSSFDSYSNDDIIASEEKKHLGGRVHQKARLSIASSDSIFRHPLYNLHVGENATT